MLADHLVAVIVPKIDCASVIKAQNFVFFWDWNFFSVHSQLVLGIVLVWKHLLARELNVCLERVHGGVHPVIIWFLLGVLGSSLAIEDWLVISEIEMVGPEVLGKLLGLAQVSKVRVLPVKVYLV